MSFQTQSSSRFFKTTTIVAAAIAIPAAVASVYRVPNANLVLGLTIGMGVCSMLKAISDSVKRERLTGISGEPTEPPITDNLPGPSPG